MALRRRDIGRRASAMPGAFNAATARLVEQAGFSARLRQRRGLANATAGVPDIGLLTLTEVAQLAGYVAPPCNIPALVDADTGFGGAGERRADRARVRAGRARRAPPGRPGVPQALRPPGRQGGRAGRRDGRENRGRPSRARATRIS